MLKTATVISLLTIILLVAQYTIAVKSSGNIFVVVQLSQNDHIVMLKSPQYWMKS